MFSPTVIAMQATYFTSFTKQFLELIPDEM